MALRVRVLEGQGLKANGLKSCYVAVETPQVKHKTIPSRSHKWDEEFRLSVAGRPTVMLKVQKPIHLPGTSVLSTELPYTDLAPGVPTKKAVKFPSGAVINLVLTLTSGRPGSPGGPSPPRHSLPALFSRTSSSARPPRTMSMLMDELPDDVDRVPWEVVKQCMAAGRKIGEGGFGPVYQATLPDGRVVAIKFRDPNSMQGLKEFALEVELVCPLRHPSIVKVIGVAFEGPNLALLYPFFKNGTLEGVVASSTLTWETRLHVGRDIAEGLSVLHALKPPILHRDLSPDNVLLADDFRAKLADFGTARECPELLTQEFVRDEPRGKWHYMAPEVRETGLWSTGADVYALGVVLLQLLAGLKEPTHEGAPLVTLRAQELPRAVPWPPPVHGALHALALKCLAPCQARIKAWRLAADLQELLASALMLNCPKDTVAALPDCTWCEKKPRATRLSCGHCVMCEDCTREVVAEFAMCPTCQTTVTSWTPLQPLDPGHTYLPPP